LQSRRQLLVVIDYQNGFQRETIDMRLKPSRMRLGFHYDAGFGQQSWCQVAGSEAEIDAKGQKIRDIEVIYG
jgi:hypothetical protein